MGLLKNQEPMLAWPYEVSSLTAQEIAEFTGDPNWQTIRLSMKSISTGFKLRVLRAYRKDCIRQNAGLSRKHEVQIDNYINALKRGGQLDSNLRVVK